MTRAFPFTEARVASIQPPATGREYHKDTRFPGLQVCVTAAGKRTFYFVKRIGGRPTRVLLGTTSQLSVEQARKVAAEKSGEIAKGRNPQADRLQNREEATLAELASHWLETHAKALKRTWKEDERQIKTFLKILASRKLSTIKQTDVRAIHSKVGRENGRYAANRLLALVRAMFNRASEIGFTGVNPSVGISKFPEEKRDRFLHGDELKQFFASLEAEPNPLIRDFFLVALMTGARRANVQAMAWADLDMGLGFWRIPTTKSGKPVVVPLTGPVLAILKARRDAMVDPTWVFPSHGKTGHLVEPKAAWKRLLTRAGLEDARPHDLRRSLASWMAIGNTALPVIGKMLGHTQQSTTQIYARLSLDPVRAAAEQATTAMLAAAGVKIVVEGSSDGEESTGNS